MAFYSSSDELYEVMTALMDRLARDSSPDRISGKMRINITLTDPAATFCINTRVFPPQARLGSPCHPSDLGVKTTADTIHQMWSGQLGVRAAIGQGRLEIQGNPIKALTLKPLFDEAKVVYPVILRERGRLP